MGMLGMLLQTRLLVYWQGRFGIEPYMLYVAIASTFKTGMMLPTLLQFLVACTEAW
jgi:hypothetical protein